MDGERSLVADGLPAHTTSAGWLGYPRVALPERAREALTDGFTHLKPKIGGELERDLRRARLVRDAIGPEHRLSLDANQAWGAEQEIEDIGCCRRSIRGGSRSRRAPTTTSASDGFPRRSRRCAWRPASTCRTASSSERLLPPGAVNVCQLGGASEALAVALLAAKFGVPSCPHAGGVGPCQYAQRVSMFDNVAVGATAGDRVCEFVDHLHAQFVDPVRVVRAGSLAPTTSGYSIEIRPESVSEYAFPDGPGRWREEEEVPA